MSAYTEHTEERAVQAIRELIQHAHPEADIGVGWCEDVVEKMTVHILATLAEQQSRAPQRFDRGF